MAAAVVRPHARVLPSVAVVYVEGRLRAPAALVVGEAGEGPVRPHHPVQVLAEFHGQARLPAFVGTIDVEPPRSPFVVVVRPGVGLQQERPALQYLHHVLRRRVVVEQAGAALRAFVVTGGDEEEAVWGLSGFPCAAGRLIIRPPWL